MPEIVGGVLACAETVIENAGSAALAMPSLTLITILERVPVTAGVPLNRPVEVLKLAPAGALAIEKVSVLPSASAAVG